MPTPSLKEFAQSIPVCEQTCSLADVLAIFRSSGCNEIVAVNQQHCPLGVVNLPQVMLHLISSQQSEESLVAMAAKDGGKPLSQLESPIIEPLIILPAHLNLSQFWRYLQKSKDRRTRDWGQLEDAESGRRGDAERLDECFGEFLASSFTPPSRQHWALVDEEGKFLGLLNSWLLLESLAPTLAALDATSSEPESQPTSLKSLVQLLEHLPLPLSLETATGQVLAQNLTWRQQIGTSSNLDWVRHTTAAMLDVPSDEPCACSKSLDVPRGSVTLPHEECKTCGEAAFSVPNTVKERHGTSSGAAQRYCAIDTPRLATAISTQQVISSAPPLGKTQESPTRWKAPIPAPETLRKSQERVFSFVKIPLSPDTPSGRSLFAKPSGDATAALSLFERSIAGEGENEQAATRSPYHPLYSDLCLVVAQDTTEQQQVTKELAAKNADLIQLNRLKDEFLACISHELRTPLTAVLGLSTLLKDQALGELNERQTRYAKLIYQSGRQLMTLVNDILDLTRMETGQLELTCEPVQIQSVCDRAYSQAQQLQLRDDQEEESTPDIQFTLEIEPGLEMLVADELRLRQMLVHLLSNALKFTEVGGEIGLRVNCWEGWIAFTVWDTGIGIPPEKQHLIFQKFQQLEHPLTRRYEGTGLGLVLTQRLARLHGGDVSFISKLGEGSQFTLLLPPCPPQGSGEDGEIFQCKVQNPQMEKHQAKRNRLVLIVETVPCYLDSLTEQLKSLGYRVVIARSGTEAIEKARRLQPRAILLNPLLPQLSGWDVLTLLKSDAQTLHIPVLVTATQAEKQQAYHNKADGFLNLPVQKQALLQSFACLGVQECPVTSGLTILHLSPVERYSDTSVQSETGSDSSNLSYELTEILSLQHSELNYRVLEADDLEQAELLARIWHPDVVLLDGAQIADPLAYLKQFSSHPNLSGLPLITLEHQTTEAANQITGLSVYPCLAPDNSSKIAALLQVIQVAVGMGRLPSILVMDIGEQGLTEAEENLRSRIPPSQRSRNKNISSSQSGRTAIAAGGSSGVQGRKSQSAIPQTSQSSWLQALIQYLQTAGFRTVLSCSWTEIYHQIQEQSVDLLLIRLNDISGSSALVNGLIALAQLQNLPPILVLDHRLNVVSVSDSAQAVALPLGVASDSASGASKGSALRPFGASELAVATLEASSKAVASASSSQLDQAVTGGGDSTSNLDSLLKAVATQILCGHSLSMTQLLDRINQLLMGNG